ncbi:MAG: hypothetical protein H6628_14800 [Calditrichae bacterium]|nr:hypothetical protein [Calditrichia bacterium]
MTAPRILPDTACVTRYRDFSSQSREAFLQAGYKPRYFFPHKSFFLPRCGPDGYKMARRMTGRVLPDQLWEIVLYAGDAVLDEFPRELFFDDDLVWHQQHLGRPGQIATANLIISDGRLYTNNHLSDIVQRISRRRQYKTRIENRFKGWPYLLLNSILNFALENHLRQVCIPSADFVLQHSDPSRNVQRELFDRIYDRAVTRHYRTSREGNWWVIDLAENRSKVVAPEPKTETLTSGKTICIYHDTEKGLGHAGIDRELVRFANEMAPQYLRRMLDIEARAGIQVTYNVVGQLLEEVRGDIASGGHSLAFHSFDHKVPFVWAFLKRHPKLNGPARRLIAKTPFRNRGRQLQRCRTVDYRLKGYRAPQSVLTDELSDRNLCFYNFEWFGCWMSPANTRSPVLENRLVKIPMQFDDWSLYREQMTFREWEEKALKTIQENDFTAIGLHDCYAQYWIDHYKDFIGRISGLGQLKTIDAVSNNVFLMHAQ